MLNNSKILYYILIIGFILLYVVTALISFCHAIEFFAIGNLYWMAVALAGVFEVGQMVVLSSLLLTDNKNTVIPWLLLIVLTSIQVVGNVFSVYKFISLSASTMYVYLQKPLIDWWLAGVSQETIVVIISWIIGAMLPIIALFMTSMVSNNIKLLSKDGEGKQIAPEMPISDDLSAEHEKTGEPVIAEKTDEPEARNDEPEKSSNIAKDFLKRFKKQKGTIDTLMMY